MRNLSEPKNNLSGNIAIVPYQEQMLRSDEKFERWARKSFADRQSVFKKLTTLNQHSEDLLSNWVAEQMDILLAKSVMG